MENDNNRLNQELVRVLVRVRVRPEVLEGPLVLAPPPPRQQRHITHNPSVPR